MKNNPTYSLVALFLFVNMMLVSCTLSEMNKSQPLSLNEKSEAKESDLETENKTKGIKVTTDAQAGDIKSEESITTPEVTTNGSTQDIEKVTKLATVNVEEFATKKVSETGSFTMSTSPIAGDIKVTYSGTISASPTISYDLGTVSTVMVVADKSRSRDMDKSVATYPKSVREEPVIAYDEVSSGTEPIKISGAEASSSHAAFNPNLAGKLTAGEINDFQKWKMWEDIASNELLAYQQIWKMNPQERYSVIVQSETGSPIIDCRVELIAKNGSASWVAKTDNTGKAELWNQLSTEKENKNPDEIRVIYKGTTYKIEKPKTIERGANTIKIKADCDIPSDLDILFTVDATGSMGDEIAYLQAELVDVVTKVKDKHKDVNLQLGSVFYRDHGDTYVTINSPFSKDISTTSEFIAGQYADGGGDGPEAVDDAFAESVDAMKWSPQARARLMFLILDAPPHGDKTYTDKMSLYIQKAAEKGIRVIPLVASGGGYDLDKSLEYLMRCCALGTNGTYAFLTDHSGIGGTHTAPSTDKYEVETLNALLIRIIDQFVFVPECNLQQFVLDEHPLDTALVVQSYPVLPIDTIGIDSIQSPNQNPTLLMFVLKCYPNPSSDYVWAETSEQVTEIFLADNSGKIIERVAPTGTLTRFDLTNYPSGVYLMKAWINNKWASSRIVVARI